MPMQIQKLQPTSKSYAPKPRAIDRAYDAYDTLTDKGKTALKRGVAGVAIVGASAGIGAGINAATNTTIPETSLPTTPVSAEPAPDYEPTTPVTAEPYQVQPGDGAQAIAAERTPFGEDTSALEAEITEQADDDGNPGLHVYNPANGTGDVLEGLPPVLPVNEDADPSNNVAPGQGGQSLTNTQTN